ncbi:hypothetical protein R6L23_37020, partial [Streptomyces sp. SR27]|uniref:hypothetical protein n=1 Tax=Streptomyces sp. SR27 TaxID=3076630 RepID=UPI00295C4FC0|nr:hypothetical protein [Streptomyces sp. SR27]
MSTLGNSRASSASSAAWARTGGGEKAGGGFAGGQVAVVPEVRGQGVGEPGVDVGLDVSAGSPGEFVARGFVPVAGLGLLQGAELAQRLELVGAGGDPLC